MVVDKELILEDNKLKEFCVVNDSKHTFTLTINRLLYVNSEGFIDILSPLKETISIEGQKNERLTLELIEKHARRIKLKGKIAFSFTVERLADSKKKKIILESFIRSYE